MAQDNASTGGLMVILGIIVALILVYFAYSTGMFGGSKTNINVSVPDVSDVAPDGK